MLAQDLPKKHILFFGEEVTLAHIVRPLSLAVGLCSESYRVSFAAGNKFAHLLRNKKFDFHPIESIDGELFLERLASGEPLYTYDDLKKYVENDISLIAELSPDFIVGDFRLSLGIAADVLNVPYANLVNGHWSLYSTQKFPVPDLPIVKTLGEALTKLLIKPFLPLVFWYHGRPFNRLRKEYGLKSVGNLKEVYSYGTYSLLTDTPSVAPTRNLPDNTKYIGPISWSPDIPLPPWWIELPNDRPVVYLTLGSSGKISLLKNIIDALAQCFVTVVMATAGRVKEHQYPVNFYFSDFLPATKILPYTALTICNGGSATAYQSLAHGVPVLGFPSNADQFFSMESITKLHAGSYLRPEKALPSNIEGCVKALLNDPKYKKCAQIVAKEIEAYNPYDFLSNFLKSINL